MYLQNSPSDLPNPKPKSDIHRDRYCRVCPSMSPAARFPSAITVTKVPSAEIMLKDATAKRVQKNSQQWGQPRTQLLPLVENVRKDGKSHVTLQRPSNHVLDGFPVAWSIADGAVSFVNAKLSDRDFADTVIVASFPTSHAESNSNCSKLGPDGNGWEALVTWTSLGLQSFRESHCPAPGIPGMSRSRERHPRPTDCRLPLSFLPQH